MDITKKNPRKSGLPAVTPAGHVRSAWWPHPAAQITLWIIVTVLAQALQNYALVALVLFLLVVSVWVCAARLLSLLRRTRWVFISLLLIYAYATPGPPCWAAAGAFSPACEGMLDGMLQLARLLAVLAGLAILLDRLPRAQLISGLYTLAYPLHYLGVPRERIAVRLALTLDYAESAVRDTSRDWRASIAALINPVRQETDSVELQLQAFMLRDWLLLGVAAAVLTGALW